MVLGGLLAHFQVGRNLLVGQTGRDQFQHLALPIGERWGQILGSQYIHESPRRTCVAALGTAATPTIEGNALCTNGAYQVTLSGVGKGGNARRSSKRGVYQFTYALTLNGASSTAIVTITVN